MRTLKSLLQSMYAGAKVRAASALIEITRPPSLSVARASLGLESASDKVPIEASVAPALGLRKDSRVHLFSRADENRSSAILVSIGREGSNDIVIDDPSVSRFHAHFLLDAEGGVTLHDAGSEHGTTVDGQAVGRRGTAPRTLSRVAFGSRAFVFVAEADLEGWLGFQLAQIAGRRSWSEAFERARSA